jgi:hypothetical protein
MSAVVKRKMIGAMVMPNMIAMSRDFKKLTGDFEL